MPPMGFKPTISAGERRLRPRGHWDRQVGYWYTEIRGEDSTYKQIILAGQVDNVKYSNMTRKLKF